MLEGNSADVVIKKAAEITVRYSDAPKNVDVKVRYVGNTTKTLSVHAAEDEDTQNS